MAHGHEWIDVTMMQDKVARFVCSGCSATKEEPLVLVNPDPLPPLIKYPGVDGEHPVMTRPKRSSD